MQAGLELLTLQLPVKWPYYMYIVTAFDHKKIEYVTKKQTIGDF